MLYIKITSERLFSEIHSEVNFPYSKAVGQLTRGNMKKLFLAFLICASCDANKTNIDVVVDSSVEETSKSFSPETSLEVDSDVSFCVADSSDSSVEDTVKSDVKVDVK